MRRKTKSPTSVFCQRSWMGLFPPPAWAAFRYRRISNKIGFLTTVALRSEKTCTGWFTERDDIHLLAGLACLAVPIWRSGKLLIRCYFIAIMKGLVSTPVLTTPEYVFLLFAVLVVASRAVVMCLRWHCWCCYCCIFLFTHVSM